MKDDKLIVLCNEKVIAEVAKELGLDRALVRKIVNFQSEYTKKIMENGRFDSVRWHYFGVFRPKMKQLQITKQMKGMSPIHRKSFRKAVKQGKVYEKDTRESKGSGDKARRQSKSKTRSD